MPTITDKITPKRDELPAPPNSTVKDQMLRDFDTWTNSKVSTDWEYRVDAAIRAQIAEGLIIFLPEKNSIQLTKKGFDRMSRMIKDEV